MGVRDGIQKAGGSGLLAFSLAILLWIVDFSGNAFSFTGLILVKDPGFYASFLRSFLDVCLPIIAGIAAFSFLTTGNMDRKQLILNIVYAVVVTFIGFWGGYRTFLHLVIPWFILWSLPEAVAPKDTRIKTLIVMYLLDFFAPSIASAFLPKEFAAIFGNTLILPWWVIYASKSAYEISNNWFYWLMLLLIVFVSVFNFFTSWQSYNLSKNNISEVRQGFFQAVTNAWNSASSSFTQSSNSFFQLFNQSYYEGEQEQTEEPQGLYLKELERGEIEYRENEPVYLWARLEARTLEKEIEASVICYAEIDDDFGTRIVRGIVDEDSKSTTETFSVISGVERSIPCIFEEGFPAGDYDITYNATFTFTTESRKKVYLMDRKRLLNDLQLLADKGGNPTMTDVLSKLYDIKDTEPKSIFTTGPIKLAIGTDKVPWDIGEKNNIKPLFGVTIENNWDRGGMIKSIDGLYLKIPDSFSFASLERSCTFPLKSQTSEEGYYIYEVEKNDDMTDIEEYITIDCHMVIDPARSLDNTPVTTRFLKTEIDYTYLMQEDISIEVKPSALSDDQEELMQNEKLCCEIITQTDRRYITVDTETQCNAYTGGGAQAKIVENALCS